MQPPENAPREADVVVLGAGFAGLHCARRLAGSGLSVVLIDRNNYHLFTPLLYQVASSLLNPSEIAYPIRSVFRSSRNVRFLMAEVAGVDFSKRLVRLKETPDWRYRYLVLALGSRTHYFGNDSARRLCQGLKDLPEAVALRNRALAAFEAADRLAGAPEERRAWLSFVIVGGGPTGVEYAGALAELVFKVLKRDFPRVPTEEVRILLVEAAPYLLAPFPEDLRRSALKDLARLGVDVRLNVKVEEVRDASVRFADGGEIASRTVIWTAGVEAARLKETPSAPKGAGGRLQVDDRLRLAGQDRVFAVGDMAAALGADAEPLSMTAPPAVQGGQYAAEAILDLEKGREPRPFRYVDRGMMVTIGRNSAVAAVGGLRVGGFLGWAAWLVLHIYLLIGFRNRLAVLWDWAWYYLLYDRPVRLITRPKNE